MSELFDNLFISCPNGGGLFFIKGRDLFYLDKQETTGIFLEDNFVLRAIQPNDLHVYTNSPRIIAGKEAGFGDVHDVLLHDGSCYIVGTEQNEVIKLNPEGEELQRWKFPGEPDSWHINCLAVWNGRIVFSAFGDFRQHRQYKENTSESGFVRDLLTGEVVVENLSQPHSVIASGTSLILANSEKKEVLEFDKQGNLSKSRTLDGYTRGIAIKDNIVYVGISRSRNIESNHVEGAAIVALDSSNFEEIGRIELPATEIYTIVCRPDDRSTIKTLATICKNSVGLMTELYENVSGEAATLKHGVEARDSEIADLTRRVVDQESEAHRLRITISDLNNQVASLCQNRDDKDVEIISLTKLASDQETEIVAIRENIVDKDNMIDSLNGVVSDRNAEIAALTQNISDQANGIIILDNRAKDHEQEIVRLKHELTETCKSLDMQRQEIAKIKRSLSWKLTKPFRRIWALPDNTN